MADNDEGEVDSEDPSSEDGQQTTQVTPGAVGAVGEARRSKNVRFADQREMEDVPIGSSSPIQGQGQGGAGWADEEVAVDADPPSSGQPQGHSVDIAIDEASTPEERPPFSREEPTPPAGGSPKQVPEPKESGRPGSPQEQLDVNVYASADEQHDADDGDDEDDQIYEARQVGGYPPGGAAQRRGAVDRQ